MWIDPDIPVTADEWPGDRNMYSESPIFLGQSMEQNSCIISLPCSVNITILDLTIIQI